MDTPTTDLQGIVQRWFRANTLTPTWLPKRWQHTAVTYVAACLVQVVAILLTAGLLQLVPGFTFRGAFILLGVIVVALTMGGAPGLLASFAGTVMLDLFLVPPYFSFAITKGADLVNVLFYLIVCLATNLASARAGERNALRKEG